MNFTFLKEHLQHFTHRQLTNAISMEWLTKQVEELKETKREDE